jgi:hypothetical protein
MALRYVQSTGRGAAFEVGKRGLGEANPPFSSVESAESGPGGRHRFTLTTFLSSRGGQRVAAEPPALLSTHPMNGCTPDMAKGHRWRRVMCSPLVGVPLLRWGNNDLGGKPAVFVGWARRKWSESAPSLRIDHVCRLQGSRWRQHVAAERPAPLSAHPMDGWALDMGKGHRWRRVMCSPLVGGRLLRWGNNDLGGKPAVFVGWARRKWSESAPSLRIDHVCRLQGSRAPGGASVSPDDVQRSATCRLSPPTG